MKWPVYKGDRQWELCTEYVDTVASLATKNYLEGTKELAETTK